MMDVLLGILIGAFIGWHIPEPTWAKVVKAKLVSLLKNDKP
jgi:hypothetical protein